MATKKKENPVESPFVNNNNNTNNINVNVQVPYPKEKRTSGKQQGSAKASKPNWILKAIVVVIIGLLVPLAFNFVMKMLDDSPGKPPVILDGSNNHN